MTNWYLDANNLQYLIESGTYEQVKLKASQNGITFKTTNQIIGELGASPKTSPVVQQWLSDAGSHIDVLPNLNPYTPGQNDAGEQSLKDYIDLERGQGNLTGRIWTDDSTAIDRWRQAVETRDLPVMRTFDGNVRGEVDSALREILHDDPVSYANIRDSLSSHVPNNSTNPSANTNRPSYQMVPADEGVGVDRYTRAPYGGSLEKQYALPGERPSGNGWVSDSEAAGMRPDMSRGYQDIEANAREQIRNIRDNPASYDINGEFTPGAMSALDAAKFVGGAVGAGLIAADMVMSYERWQAAINRGDYADASLEASGLAGRLSGLLLGAELGAAFGPVMSFVGGLAGLIVGDRALKEATLWVGDLFGGLTRPRDPLVLDLDHNGVHLITLGNSNAHFDLDGDGIKERTGWVSKGDGLLAIDLNHNGKVDDGTELFGSDGNTGFQILAQYDINHDGIINTNDAVFAELRVWRDANSDGISQSDELLTMAQAGISAISLDAPTIDWGPQRDGATVIASGHYVDTLGASQEGLSVAFATDRTNTIINLPAGTNLDPEVLTLPNIRGYGEVPDLWVAMTLDPTLKDMVQDFIEDLPDNFNEMIGGINFLDLQGQSDSLRIYYYKSSEFEDIIARWAGIAINQNDGSPAYSGGNDTLQIFEVIEKFLGQSLPARAAPQIVTYSIQSGEPGGGEFEVNFYPVTLNTELETVYQKFTADLANRFLISLAQAETNHAGLVLAATILEQSDFGSIVLDNTTIDQLVDQAIAEAESAPALPPFLQQYTSLTYDFALDSISGDIGGFIDKQLAEFPIDPTNPWANYAAWWSGHHFAIEMLDPTGAILDERFRALTHNEALPILRSGFTALTGDASDNLLTGDQQFIFADLITGGAGDDTLHGGAGSDAYVFRDGFGNDVVLDASGTADEIAFQQSLTSDRAHFAFSGSSRTDVVITFDGVGDSVTIQSYLDAEGNASIERITFADGVTRSSYSILSELMHSLATSGNDTLTAFNIGSDVFGDAGNDTLSGANGNDTLIGGAGNDTLWESEGNDTYVWNLGDGNDVIRGGNWTDGVNAIRFGAEIKTSDLHYAYFEGSTGLTISVNGYSGSISIANALDGGPGDRIDRLEFDDGTVLERAEFLAAAFAQFATNGGDALAGSQGDDTLYGYAGNDTIDARAGNDVIIGGAGDDTLVETEGNDTYVWNVGDGNDTITPGSFWDDFNTVQFGPGIAASDLRVSVSGFDVILSIDGQAGSVKLQGAIGDGFGVGIDRLRFDDGTLVARTQIMEMAIAAQVSAGNDIINVPKTGGIVDAGAGDDIINSRGSVTNSGAATISGGAGNDLIYASSGDDTYVWNIGDGNDTITQGTFWDDFNTVQFGPGIVVADLRVAVSGDDILLSISGQAGSIKLQSALRDGFVDGIDQIRFDDGTLVPRSQIMDMAIAAQATAGNDIINVPRIGGTVNAGAGNDVIYGRGSMTASGDATIIGGAGDDTIYASSGNDTYIWNLGDGNDIIRGGAFWDDFNVLRFGAGIVASDIHIAATQDGKGLLLTVNGQPGSVTLETQLVIGGEDGVDQIEFADGTVWNRAFFTAAANNAQATSGDDSIVGSQGSDVLFANAGNDTIDPRNGNDLVVGGAGNDLIYESEGNDTYVWNIGDGDDSISNWGFWDDFNTVQFGPGITASDLRVTLGTNNDVILSIDGQAGSVRLMGQLRAGGSDGIDQLRFDDGTIVTHVQFAAMALASQVTSGDDTILFPAVGGTVNAGAGNDTIYGSGSADDMAGGLGNDVLSGGSGADTYRFNLGDGQDTIRDAGDFDTSIDTLVFGAGIAPGAVTVAQANNGNDLVLNIAGTTDQVTLVNTISNSNWRVDRVAFVDGTVWSHADLMAKSMIANSGNDTFYGGDIADVLNGGAGDDTLYGRRGNDILIGGTGNDVLVGNDGMDTYRFNLGDGQDLIMDSGDFDTSIDTLEFGAGIDPAGVSVTQANNGNDFILKIAGTTDQVTLVNTMTHSDWRVDRVTFTDGTVWSHDDLMARSMLANSGNDTFYGSDAWDTLNGGAGNDTLYGRRGNDILIGGTGNDILSGNDGMDTYRFNLGDGQDQIMEAGDFDTSIDTLEFGAGIDPAAVTVVQANAGKDLILKITGTTDQITLVNTIVYTDWRVDRVTFTDGTVWSHSDLMAKSMEAVLPNNVPSGDFNGDGYYDILWRNSNGDITNWLGQSDGSFVANDTNALVSVPNEWKVSGIGDFNGDGRDDIVWRNVNGGMSEWLGKANGGFLDNGGTVGGSVPTDWKIARTGDFNGDGRDDLLWRNDNGVYSEWLGQANGGFYDNGPNANGSVSNDWKIVGTGDVNGDGRDDVLWRSTSGQFSDWLGQANGSFAVNDANAMTTVSTSSHVIGTGDFNGDGRMDVLWQNDDRQVTNWLGQANGGFSDNSTNSAFQLPTGWKVVGTGDYNGDGLDDILLRESDGSTSNWLGQSGGSFEDNDDAALTAMSPSWIVQPADYFAI